MKASIVALVGAAAVASAHNHNGTVPWTTSTVTQTRTSTISECAPTVTNCPYKKHPVTTVIVDVYTTYCPVSGSETGPTSTSSPAAPWTTSTVYETETLTISKCAPTVTNCPYTTAPITITTSSAVSTTVCPPETTSPVIVVPPVSSVSAAESSGQVTVVPPPMSLTTVSPPASETDVTITISSCPPSSVSGAITGTGSPLPTTSTLPFTGGASAQKAGGLLMAVGVVAALL